MAPEQEGQLSGEPLRSLAMRFSAWAGLYVAGRGLRMFFSLNNKHPGSTAPVRLRTANPLIL